MMKMNRVSLMCVLVLAISGVAFGYGLDVGPGPGGTKDSADFSNLLGPYGDGYPYWSYEGGAVANWAEDNLGYNQMSAYDGANFSSDGSIMTHVADETSASFSTGMYRPFSNHYYTPAGGSNNYALWGLTTNDADGFTVEWRVKLRDPANDTAWGLTSGYYFGFNVDEAANLYVRLGGYDDTDSVAKFAGGLNVPIADVTEWHNYRFAVLGDDGTGTIRANFYQDATLIAPAIPVGTAGTTDSGDYLWNGTEGGSDIAGGVHSSYIDYVRIDAQGAYAPIPEPVTMALLGLGGLLGLRRRK